MRASPNQTIRRILESIQDWIFFIQFFFEKDHQNIPMIPRSELIHTTLEISVVFDGTVTLSRAQRWNWVKTAINRKKYPRNPASERYRYAMSQRLQRRSMREVTFTPKASPVSIPARKMMVNTFFSEYSRFHREKTARNALILKNINAGSSFISFACWKTVIGML